MTKKDSSHLALPNNDIIKEGKKWNRFLAPPSSYVDTEEAQRVRAVRNRALNHSTYTGSVISYGYNGVKKEEKVVLPDGTIYYLSAFWMADPSLTMNTTIETQTPLQMLPSRITDSSTNTESTVTSVGETVRNRVTSATNTESVQTNQTDQSTQTYDQDVRIVIVDRDHHEEDDDEDRRFLSYFS